MPSGMDLKNDVLNTSSCSLCGACLDWCPYLFNLEDRLIMRFDCNVQEGRCYSVCPRTMTDWEKINDQLFDGIPFSKEIGSHTAIHKAKAVETVHKQQDGGTVSMLLQAVLKENVVSAALLTGSEDAITPYPFLSNKIEDIQLAAGSRFLATPSLRKLIEAQDQGFEKIVVVARPCQVQALRKMLGNWPPDQKPLDVLIIGLFCMWSLSWDFKRYLSEQYPGEHVERIVIPQHGMEVVTNKGIKQIPAEVVKKFIRPGCNYCLDMTSELADISVGSFEPEKGWNTVIVRSAKGQQLLDRAINQGLIITHPYPEEEANRLKRASYNKKRRGLQAIQEIQRAGQKPFIDLTNERYQEILNDTEGKVNV
ncbi:MAG: Coenzyme F420 hydrogenase/dehydrogenase, beta subunit C-terminal domain [Bacillota bacterium]|nr:Coenzyme F420 hydrogenase/dehydrogenase, beta subunit C-terminal domain [Bacillota bacterium]